MTKIWIRGRDERILRAFSKAPTEIWESYVKLNGSSDSIMTATIGKDELEDLSRNFVIGKKQKWTKRNSNSQIYNCVEVEGNSVYPLVLISPNTDVDIRHEIPDSTQPLFIHKIGMLGSIREGLVLRTFLTYYFTPYSSDMIKKVNKKDDRLMIVNQ